MSDVRPVSELVGEALAKLKIVDADADGLGQDRNLAHDQERRLLAWGVPRRAAEAVLVWQRALEPNDAFAALDDFAGAPGNRCFVLLSGPPGTGKTVAAARWLVRLPVPAGPPVYGPPQFVTAEHFSTWAPWSDELRLAMRARALVLDDLGVEYADAGGLAMSKLDALVNARYGELLPTVVTTNLDPQALAARLGERIVSRLHEAAHSIVALHRSYR